MNDEAGWVASSSSGCDGRAQASIERPVRFSSDAGK